MYVVAESSGPKTGPISGVRSTYVTMSRAVFVVVGALGLVVGCATSPPREVQSPMEPPPGAPPAPVNPQQRTASSRDPSETRTQQVITSLVVQNRDKVRACYDAARANNPDLAGTLTVHFELDPRGKVTQANVVPQRTTLTHAGLHACALDAIRAISFPPSSRGFESRVTYPFDFKP